MPQQHRRVAVTRLNSIWMSWHCSHCWPAVDRLKTRPYTSTAHSRDADMTAPVTWKEYCMCEITTTFIPCFLLVYIYSIVFIFKRSVIIVLQIRLCASYTSAFEKESPKCQVATITLSCDVCGLLLNLLCKLNIKNINISVCRIKLRLKSKPINCSECNCSWRQPVSSKDISAKRRIQGRHHNAR